MESGSWYITTTSTCRPSLTILITTFQMRKNWPYFIVASFLNTLLVTATFIEFKLRGLAVVDWPTASAVPAWYNVDPFQFAGGMFVLSFLLIVVIVTIKNLVTRVVTKLKLFNESLGNQFAMDNASPIEA